jgi:2-polyprenyl-3-methyl-5-hydroxy-6-metoxy-1,4-benzoquinol methylase
MKNKRNFNNEFKDLGKKKYAHSFDFDVMHDFMIRSFQKNLVTGNILELGSFKGNFSSKLLPLTDSLTCVEASDVAINEARNRFGNSITFINDIFENVTLPCKYDNVIMTHVLEHLDDPIKILQRINQEWLSEKGKLFLAVPNANAPSRQIAVKMGLISHNTAVTPGEKEHGHKITYTLDTLERDALAAGLNVIHRSGIFFKALANFQWDKILDTDVISPEYLEGCYQLGQIYPDLCSSIFLVCEKGNH